MSGLSTLSGASPLLMLILAGPFIGFCGLFYLINKKLGNMKAWDRVQGILVKQVPGDGLKGMYTYNIYEIDRGGQTLEIKSSIGSQPPSGTIGREYSMLYNGDQTIIPNWWIVRNARSVSLILCLTYWPIWILIGLVSSFKIFS